MSTFAPENWFNKLFGFKESVNSVKEHITLKKVGDNYILTSEKNNLSYNAGNFQVKYISGFDLNDPKKFPIRNGGTLNILCGNGSRTIDKEQIDAFEMQSLQINDGATFLAASNFNCLEFTSPSQTARDGVTNYIYDHTQGPYLALACPQCAVFRNYFVEFKDSDGKNVSGQIDTQINLLSKTPINVINGYAIIEEEDSEKLSSSGFNWEDENNYAVGIHTNCEVIMTRGINCFKYLGHHKLGNDKIKPIKIALGVKNQDDVKQSKLETVKNEQKNSDVNLNVEKNDSFDAGKNQKNSNENLNAEKNSKKSDNEMLNEKNEDVNNDLSTAKTNIEDSTDFPQTTAPSSDDKTSKTSECDVNHINVVNHVYAAALNFYGDVCRDDFTYNLAYQILKAEYKAAVLAGWENSVKMEEEGRTSAKILFLTLLGGGVFGVPFEIIAKAITACKDLIVKSGLDVWVVCFDNYSFNKVNEILMPVVDETGGWVDYVE